MRGSFAAAALAAAVGLAAGPASATVYHVTGEVGDFVGAGCLAACSWFNSGSPPYGLSGTDVISFSFDVSDATRHATPFGYQDNGEAISNLSYTTGSRTWTDSDIDVASSFVDFYSTSSSGAGAPADFLIRFVGLGNYFTDTNAAQIGDGANIQECNVCVSDNLNHNVSGPAPEPAGWATMVLGLGVLGAGLRRRQLA